jgi:hypothetical protein
MLYMLRIGGYKKVEVESKDKKIIGNKKQKCRNKCQEIELSTS